MREALSGTERRWETAVLLLSTSMATWGPGGWRVKGLKLRALQLILMESSGFQRAARGSLQAQYPQGIVAWRQRAACLFVFIFFLAMSAGPYLTEWS